MDQADIRARTLRRQARNERKKELERDLDIIDRKRIVAIHPKAVAFYDTLYDKLYEAYLDVVSSEV